MAQKPIGYYGEFRPTGVDQSAARRFQALAGLADQVGDIATAFGKKKVAEQATLKEQNDIVAAESAGRLAGNASAIGKTPPELTVYGDISTLAADKARNAATMAAFNAGTQNAITQMLAKLAAENPTNISAFETLTKAAFAGMTASVPKDRKPAFEHYFNQVRKTYGSNIYTAQKKQADEIADAEMKTAVTDQEVNISNLARSGEELNDAALSYLQSIRDALDNGLLTGQEYATRLEKVKDTIVTQSALGRFDLIFENEEQTPEQRIASGQNAIDQIKKKDTFQVEDPFDPEKMITLDADEKDALVAKLEGELKDFRADELKKAEAEIEASRFEQIASYAAAQETVQDPGLSDKEKRVAIAEAQMRGEIGEGEAARLRSYVNAVESLNAVTNSDVMGDIIKRAHDLNADQSLAPDSNSYLEGVNNLQDEILAARANGELTSESANTLTKQLTSLTAAKTAGATSELSYNYTKAEAVIKDSLPPDLWGVARRELLDAVNARKEELEAERAGHKNSLGDMVRTGQVKFADELSIKEVTNLWGDLAPIVVARIIEERRMTSIERVNAAREKEPVVKPPQEPPVSRFTIRVPE
jgi:hypothetical protein